MTHAIIEIFIAAKIVVGIILLYFENKHSSQKTAIERNVLSFKEIRSITRPSLSIKCEQNDKKTFENSENYTFSEVFRISGDSQFCWLDMYGGNTYWPIFWGKKSEESKDE